MNRRLSDDKRQFFFTQGNFHGRTHGSGFPVCVDRLRGVCAKLCFLAAQNMYALIADMLAPKGGWKQEEDF